MADAELVLAAHATLAEGPCWHPDSGHLTWVDIEAGALHRLDLRTGEDASETFGETLGFAQRHAAGGLVLGLEHRVARLSPDGALETIAALETGDADLRLNDGKPAPGGRLLCGSLSRSRAPRGSLYRVDADGSTTVVRSGLPNSNGLGTSPDGRTVYHADTAAARVDRLAYDPETGELGPPRAFVALEDGAGKPDGLAVDAEGGVWVCAYRGGAVRRYAPDGTLDRIVPIGTPHVTCCAFAGPGLRELYVTTAAQGTEGDPLAGCIFRIDPGVAGLAVPAFGDAR